jgi:hypothetical protein
MTSETNEDIKVDIIKKLNLGCGDNCPCAVEFAKSLSTTQVMELTRLKIAKKRGVKRLGKIGWVSPDGPRRNCPMMPLDAVEMIGKQWHQCG